MIYEVMGQPPVPWAALAGPAYTLNIEGTAVLFALGAASSDHPVWIKTPWSTPGDRQPGAGRRTPHSGDVR